MRHVLFAVSMLFVLAACGSDPETENVCTGDSRADTYVAGLEKMTSDDWMVMLMESNPAPPSMGTNEWMLHIQNPAGTNVSDATLTVTPFMPDHGHGSTMDPVITPEGEGMYKVATVYLFMEGLWQTTVDVTPVGESKKSVTFNFCVTE